MEPINLIDNETAQLCWGLEVSVLEWNWYVYGYRICCGFLIYQAIYQCEQE